MLTHAVLKGNVVRSVAARGAAPSLCPAAAARVACHREARGIRGPDCIMASELLDPRQLRRAGLSFRTFASWLFNALFSYYTRQFPGIQTPYQFGSLSYPEVQWETKLLHATLSFDDFCKFESGSSLPSAPHAHRDTHWCYASYK